MFESQFRVLYSCIQYTCHCCIIHMTEDGVWNLQSLVDAFYEAVEGLPEISPAVHTWPRTHKHSQGFYVPPGSQSFPEVDLESVQLGTFHLWPWKVHDPFFKGNTESLILLLLITQQSGHLFPFFLNVFFIIGEFTDELSSLTLVLEPSVTVHNRVTAQRQLSSWTISLVDGGTIISKRDSWAFCHCVSLGLGTGARSTMRYSESNTKSSLLAVLISTQVKTWTSNPGSPGASSESCRQNLGMPGHSRSMLAALFLCPSCSPLPSGCLAGYLACPIQSEHKGCWVNSEGGKGLLYLPFCNIPNSYHTLGHYHFLKK